MNARSFLVVLTLVALVAPTAAMADRFQSFFGDTTGAPTFNRPNGGTSPGLSNRQVRYRTQSFSIPADAICIINSGQDYDGYIHLYQGSFNPNLPLVNLIDGDDDGELGIGTSRIPSDLDVNSVSLQAGDYVLVSSAWQVNTSGAYQISITCSGAAQPRHGVCPQYFPGVPRDNQVCLQDRFVVSIDWRTNSDDGIATPVRTGSGDTAIFWFFNGRNWEVMAKVINACNFNGFFWVFGGALTNQEYEIFVGDANTGQINSYFNPLGNRSGAIADTAAFPCP